MLGFIGCTGASSKAFRAFGAIRRGGCMGATRTAATARSAASGSLRATVAVVAAAASAAAAAAAEAAASPFGVRNLVEQRLGGNRSSSQPEEPLVTTSSLLSGFKQHVRPLLELNAFLDREVVPILRQGRSSDAAQASTARIVVVGDQSHGKTSLLEALSTVDLPRGEGIKTRCPLVLQLRGLREGGGSECAFISAPEIAEERIGDLSKIPRAVEEMTERLAGTAKDVSDVPITLRIYRRDLDDLDLIDLPGITRVAVAGQSMPDVELEQRIKQMCLQYMAPESCVVLNVVSDLIALDCA